MATSDASGSWECRAFWDNNPDVLSLSTARDGACHRDLHSVGEKMGRAACPSKIRQ